MLSDVLSELQALNLSAMGTRLQQWLDDPKSQGKSHLECVLALAQAQAQTTANRRARRLLRRAELPDDISLGNVWTGPSRGLSPQLLANLATSQWVERGQTVVITGPSRVGKTYLMAALAQEAALARLSVAYWRVPELLEACALEKDHRRWVDFLKQLKRHRLLVLDDFATEYANRDQSHWLRQIIDGLQRRRHAVMVASPNVVDDWGTYFEDATAADAIFGRLLDQCQSIDLKPLPRKSAPRRQA